MASSYDHVQTTASATWTITHNLNSAAVAIDVYIDNAGTKEKIIPVETKHVSNNTIEVTFSSIQTGNARIVI